MRAAERRQIVATAEGRGVNLLRDRSRGAAKDSSVISLHIPCAEVAIAGLDKLLRKVSFFNLNRGVVDMELFAGDTIHPGEKFSPVEAVGLSDNMAAHCQNPRRQCPYVKIMNRPDTIHASQLFSQADDV